MENFNHTFPNLMTGAEIFCNSVKNQDKPAENYENTSDALSYDVNMKMLEKPLTNETEVLRYSNIMRQNVELDSNLSAFDAEDEYQKIVSGYYINIDEALNMFKQYYNIEPNPFKEFHTNAMEYIKFLQQQNSNQNTEINTKPVNTATVNISDSESDKLLIDTTSENSYFNVSPSGLEILEIDASAVSKEHAETIATQENNLSNVATQQNNVATQQNNLKLVNNKKRRSKPKKRLVKNIFAEMSHKKTPKTSTPNKNVPTVPLSPISGQISLSGVTPQEFELLQQISCDEDKEYLDFLETQYNTNVFHEYGRTVCPILTHRDFEGISYDFYQELINSEIIRREFFSRLTVFRKFPF